MGWDTPSLNYSHLCVSAFHAAAQILKVHPLQHSVNLPLDVFVPRARYSLRLAGFVETLKKQRDHSLPWAVAAD